MLSNCASEIFSCYADTSCRTALDCLTGCRFNDQAGAAAARGMVVHHEGRAALPVGESGEVCCLVARVTTLAGALFLSQVCSYRCIASYESPQLASFSLCIMQKHNCLGLTASRPLVRAPAL